MSQQTIQTPIPNPSSRSQGETHSIGIAGLLVVKAPDKIRTVLGSCIGIAIYDLKAKIGGMAHVILPASSEGSGDPGKFADTAVDLLVDNLIQAGSDKTRLIAKIVGGASMFGDEKTGRLGTRNAQAVQDQLNKHSIPLKAKDLGGMKGRRMLLDPATGEVQVSVIGGEPKII